MNEWMIDRCQPATIDTGKAANRSGTRNQLWCQLTVHMTLGMLMCEMQMTNTNVKNFVKEQTFCHAKLRAWFFFWSSSLMVCKIFALSFSTILFFFMRSLYCRMEDKSRQTDSDKTATQSPEPSVSLLTLSSASFSMFMALLLTFLSSLVVVSSSFFSRWPASRGLLALKS